MQPILRVLALLFAGGFLLYAGNSSAQNLACSISLKGQLISEEGNIPLSYASVHIPELNRGVITDSSGFFSLSNLCPGDYTLICTHAECAHTEFHQHLDGHTHEVQISLPAKDYELEAITIKGIGPAEIPTQTVSVVEQRALFNGQSTNLARALESLPGVNSFKTGATIAKPVIHGLHSNRILILNNGIRLEGQQWGSEHAPEIDPFIATRLTVLKGAAAVRYGSGAMAGVVIVEPAALPDSMGIHGSLTTVGHTNGRIGVVSGRVEGRLPSLPGWAWRLQGTLKHGGNLHTPNYFLENTGQRERNFSIAAGYNATDKGLEFFFSRFDTRLGILSASHTGSRGDLERAIAAEQPAGSEDAVFSYEIGRPYQSVAHNLAKVRAYHRIGEVGKLTATYAFQYNKRREFDTHGPIGVTLTEDDAQLDFRISTQTLELLYESEPASGWESTVGAFGIYQNNALEGQPFIPNFVSIGAEAFAIERWTSPSARLTLEGGIRYDYRYLHSARREASEVIYEIRQFHNLSGTVGGRYQIAPLFALSVNLSSSWRPPHVNELFSDGLHHGSATVEKGNPNLDAEQALKGIATITYGNSLGLSGEFSAYYHYFQNFIYKRPNGLDRTIRGTFPSVAYDQAPARLLGTDLSIKYRWRGGLSLAGKGSWLQADNLAEDQPLIFMPANWGEVSLAFEMPEAKSWHKPRASVSLRHVARQNRVPVYEDPEANDLLPAPDAFSLINLDFGTRVRVAGQTLQIGGSVENLLNTRYREYLDRFRYFTDAVGRNVSLRMELTF